MIVINSFWSWFFSHYDARHWICWLKFCFYLSKKYKQQFVIPLRYLSVTLRMAYYTSKNEYESKMKWLEYVKYEIHTKSYDGVMIWCYLHDLRMTTAYTRCGKKSEIRNELDEVFIWVAEQTHIYIRTTKLNKKRLRIEFLIFVIVSFFFFYLSYTFSLHCIDGFDFTTRFALTKQKQTTTETKSTEHSFVADQFPTRKKGAAINYLIWKSFECIKRRRRYTGQPTTPQVKQSRGDSHKLTKAIWIGGRECLYAQYSCQSYEYSKILTKWAHKSNSTAPWTVIRHRWTMTMSMWPVINDASSNLWTSAHNHRWTAVAVCPAMTKIRCRAAVATPTTNHCRCANANDHHKIHRTKWAKHFPTAIHNAKNAMPAHSITIAARSDWMHRQALAARCVNMYSFDDHHHHRSGKNAMQSLCKAMTPQPPPPTHINYRWCDTFRLDWARDMHNTKWTCWKCRCHAIMAMPAATILAPNGTRTFKNHNHHLRFLSFLLTNLLYSNKLCYQGAII